MKVYVICRPCEDPYYDGHPTGIAYITKKSAEDYCKSQSCSDNYPDPDYDLYVREIDLLTE